VVSAVGKGRVEQKDWESGGHGLKHQIKHGVRQAAVLGEHPRRVVWAGAARAKALRQKPPRWV
jgi:hypothetical protein